MISRRKLFALLGFAVPAAAAAVKAASAADIAAADAAVKAANPIYVYGPDARTLLPTEPSARIIRLRWIYEREYEHKWDMPQTYPMEFGYAGSGYKQRPQEPRHAEWEETAGEGPNPIAAIDDWAQRLPHDERFDTLIWRAKPEIFHERDFARQETTWRVYSRFARIRSPKT